MVTGLTIQPTLLYLFSFKVVLRTAVVGGRLTFFQPKQKSSFVSYVSDSEDDVL